MPKATGALSAAMTAQVGLPMSEATGMSFPLSCQRTPTDSEARARAPAR